MYLIKFQTATKIATIKALRTASSTLEGRNFSLRYTKDMVENGLLVETHNTPMAMELIAGAQSAIQYDPGLDPKPSFTVTIEEVKPVPAPVKLSSPEFSSAAVRQADSQGS